MPVVFSGGLDTDPRDHGRPVVLIAAGLEVAPAVFREAFTRVRPARGGSWPRCHVERVTNKAVLMEALEKHGVTNERLDIVSDYYRFPPGKEGRFGQTNRRSQTHWVKDGVVIGHEIISGGSGYSSSPTVSVPGVKEPKAKVELSYGKDLETNGSVSAITIALPKAK